ncbi:hypothetical protein AGMMS49975_04120 [Clostridia bacterium]|nr:hypothetical protein AGMMS49975_04120 [Clostridia bacterium]
METTALLRTLLYQIQMSKTVEEAARAVRVMCSKEDIAAVAQEVAEAMANKAGK